MIAIIADIIHRFTEDMKTKTTDRAILDGQICVGRCYRQWVEGDAVVLDNASNLPFRSHQANTNCWFPFPDAVHEDVADKLVQRDQHLSGRAIGHTGFRQKSLGIIHQALQTGMSIGQGTVEFGRHDTDRFRMQGKGLRGFSLIEWKKFSIAT